MRIVCLIVDRVLDGLDGVVARQRNKQTDFGGYLDIILDFTVYSIIPVAIVFSHAAEDCMSEGRAALCLSSKNVCTPPSSLYIFFFFFFFNPTTIFGFRFSSN